MKRIKSSAFRLVRDVFRDRGGTAAILFAAGLPMLMGAAAVTVDVGRALAAKRALDAETQAAALAGAYALSQGSWTTTSVQNAVTSWITANPAPGVTATGTTTTLTCDTSVTNLPSCSSTNPNAVSVSRTATMPTYFLKALGTSSLTLASSAVAAKAGGGAKAVNVMFVLDATGSMSNTDPGCTVPGISHPTRFQCAQYSVQSVLKVLSTSMDKAGLMVFPGMGSQYSPTKHPCPSQPSSVPYYSTSIHYQVGTSLDATFNNGNGTLNDSSPLVQAVGDGTALTGCLTNKGGEGSFGAEVLAKANAALGTPPAGTQNVIIYLSDGDYNASLSQLNNQSSHVTKQCDQAISAAQTITSAGTKIYAVAYGAPLFGCSVGDTHNPCTTMQNIASDQSTFYSTDSTCWISGSKNNVSSLPLVFQAISSNFTKPRLLLK